jgi:hypothetical protein
MVHSELRVDLEGDRVVTLTGTHLRASYTKSADTPQLVQSSHMMIHNRTPLPREQFEALALEAANEKARELGWIV